MTPNYANYFNLLSTPKDLDIWGVAVTSVSYQRVYPGEAYPQDTHPSGQVSNWERGQIHECLKLVLITSGRGTLEMRNTGVRRVPGGNAFIILPGMWHRYQPDPKTGWEESTVELRGPTVDMLIERRLLSPEDIIHRVTPAGRLESEMKYLHGLARVAVRSDPVLSSIAMRLLAYWVTHVIDATGKSRVTQAIQRAERILTEQYKEKIAIPAVAKEVGMAYSHFRREFKARTGRTPVEYYIRVRLRHACRLLLATDATLEDIAFQVGFSSGFHLSTQFKKTFGVSPWNWKRQIVE